MFGIYRHTMLYLCPYNIIEGVPLATEPGISLIILTPIKILQQNLSVGPLLSFEAILSVLMSP